MSAGFAPQGLSRLHDVMAGYVERGELPGLVTLVGRHGEVHADAIGGLNLGERDTMRRDTIFRISSMTKPITAVATLILVDEGRLRLDDPVDRLLPELAERRVLRSLASTLDDTEPAARPITVRDLLSFTMGFGMVMAAPGTYPIQGAIEELNLHQGPPHPDGMPDPEEWIRRLGTLPLMHQPGASWMYNTGADVLGVLVARASGQPFEKFLRDRVFEPLGMKDTGFNVPAAKIGRLATSYMTNHQTWKFEVYDRADGGQWSRPPTFPAGGAGLVSTADDYFAFGRMMLNKGELRGRRVLSRASVEAMTKDQLTPQQKAASVFVPGFFDNLGWGFCTAVVTGPGNDSGPEGSYGWDGGMGSSWRNDPSSDMVTILMTQSGWSSPMPPSACVDFWSAAYAAIDD
jgi:CubicO group peptidase (beta-lactamase class C family)